MPRKTSPALWPKDVLEARMRDDLTYRRFGPGVTSDHGVVSCSAYGIAAEVGAEVLRMGGNAMDAGIATALTQIPFSCGDYVSFAGVISGLYYDAAAGKVETVEGFWNLPKAETDWATIPSVNEAGNGRTALIPGFMAAVDVFLKRFGTMSLADLLEPAIFFAEHGFELGKMGKVIQSKRDVLSLWPATKAIFFKPDGEPYGPGDWFRQPKLAETLRKLADQGVDYMYRGEWADHFVETVQAAGGKATREDLANYKADLAPPDRVTVFGVDACLVPGEPYGAAQTVAGLKALDIGGAAKFGPIAHSAPGLVRFAQALGYPNEFYGGSFGVAKEDLVQRWRSLFGEAFDGASMLSERNIELYWRAIDEGRFVPDSLASLPPGPAHSDCVAVIDCQGNMLTITHSANQMYFGNTGLSVDGIMLTDSGAQVSGIGSGPRADGRVVPFVAPSVMYCRTRADQPGDRDPEPVLATGAIGMGLINKSICHAYNVLGLGMNVIEAQHAGSVMAPDMFAAITGGTPDASIFVDESQFDPEVLAQARALGLRVKDSSQASMQADVNGGPFLEGFTVGVERKDGQNFAVGVNWMNSKAVAE